MKGIYGMAVAAAAGLMSQTLAAPTNGPKPTVVKPKKNGWSIAHHNTLNTTVQASEMGMRPQSKRAPLQFSLINNFEGEQMYAYVTGKDVDDAVVMLSSNGTWYYPDAAGSAEPVPVDGAQVGITVDAVGSVTEFSIPDYMSSGRVYVSEGELTFNVVASADGATTLVEPAPTNPEDPSAGLNWGFVELTNTEEGGIYANISFVDFVGLVMGMKLTLGSGETQEVIGLQQDAVQKICDDMISQAGEDGMPWDQMCQTGDDGKALRIVAPNMYVGDNPGSFDGYYSDYIEEAWSKFAEQDLVIDTQRGDLGLMPCRVEGEDLVCDGESFPKPTESDILGCNSGPFENNPDSDSELRKAVVPRLCAAFHRSTILAGNGTEPGPSPDTYYTVDPTVHYSRIVHEYEIDGKGYTFSYDDVNPEGHNAAGVVAGMDPMLLEISIGGTAQ